MPKIGPAGEIRIPKSHLLALEVGPGDYLEIEKTREGLLLLPRKLTDVDQAWYWREEWKDRVKAGEDKRGGRITTGRSSKDKLPRR